MFLKGILYLCVLTCSYTQGSTLSSEFVNEVKKGPPVVSKPIKDDWKTSKHEEHLNRHSWVLLPENEHFRFKRTVPYDDKTFPYKDIGRVSHNNTKNNNNISHPINTNSVHTATTKKKKYHRLAHSVHVQSDIRYR